MGATGREWERERAKIEARVWLELRPQNIKSRICTKIIYVPFSRKLYLVYTKSALALHERSAVQHTAQRITHHNYV